MADSKEADITIHFDTSTPPTMDPSNTATPVNKASPVVPPAIEKTLFDTPPPSSQPAHPSPTSPTSPPLFGPPRPPPSNDLPSDADIRRMYRQIGMRPPTFDTKILDLALGRFGVPSMVGFGERITLEEVGRRIKEAEEKKEKKEEEKEEGEGVSLLQDLAEETGVEGGALGQDGRAEKDVEVDVKSPGSDPSLREDLPNGDASVEQTVAPDGPPAKDTPVEHETDQNGVTTVSVADSSLHQELPEGDAPVEQSIAPGVQPADEVPVKQTIPNNGLPSASVFDPSLHQAAAEKDTPPVQHQTPLPVEAFVEKLASFEHLRVLYSNSEPSIQLQEGLPENDQQVEQKAFQDSVGAGSMPIDSSMDQALPPKDGQVQETSGGNDIDTMGPPVQQSDAARPSAAILEEEIGRMLAPVPASTESKVGEKQGGSQDAIAEAVQVLGKKDELHDSGLEAVTEEAETGTSESVTLKHKKKKNRPSKAQRKAFAIAKAGSQMPIADAQASGEAAQGSGGVDGAEEQGGVQIAEPSKKSRRKKKARAPKTPVYDAVESRSAETVAVIDAVLDSLEAFEITDAIPKAQKKKRRARKPKSPTALLVAPASSTGAEAGSPIATTDRSAEPVIDTVTVPPAESAEGPPGAPPAPISTYAFSPIDNFFANYAFDFNPAAPVHTEFEYLAEAYGWDDKTYTDHRKTFCRAVAAEFMLGRAGWTELEILQDLCAELGATEEEGRRLGGVGACRRFLKTKFVNIFDLINARRAATEVKVWRSFVACRKYTLADGEGRWFPKKVAKEVEGGVLGLLVNFRGRGKAVRERAGKGKEKKEVVEGKEKLEADEELVVGEDNAGEGEELEEKVEGET